MAILIVFLEAYMYLETHIMHSIYEIKMKSEIIHPLFSNNFVQPIQYQSFSELIFFLSVEETTTGADETMYQCIINKYMMSDSSFNNFPFPDHIYFTNKFCKIEFGLLWRNISK